MSCASRLPRFARGRFSAWLDGSAASNRSSLTTRSRGILSDAAWRMWISMWLLADDHGLLRAADRYLAANVWQDTSRDVVGPLHDLIRAGLVVPYSVNGQRYVRIRGWVKHQRVDNASKARVPTPDLDDGVWNQELTSVLSNSRTKPRQPAEEIDNPPLARAPAQSRGETPILRSRSPTTDHRPRARRFRGERWRERVRSDAPHRQAEAIRQAS